MSARDSDRTQSAAPRWGPLVRPFRLAAAALSDPAPRLVSALVRAEEVVWLAPELELLEFSPFGALPESVPEPWPQDAGAPAVRGDRSPAARRRTPARASGPFEGRRAAAGPVFSFRRRAPREPAEEQARGSGVSAPLPDGPAAGARRRAPSEDVTGSSRDGATEREAAVRAGEAGVDGAAADGTEDTAPAEPQREPLALLEQLVTPLYARRRRRDGRSTRRQARPNAALPAPARRFRPTRARPPEPPSGEEAAAGAPPRQHPGRSRSQPAPSPRPARERRELFPGVPSARSNAAPTWPAAPEPPTSGEPEPLRLVAALAEDVLSPPRPAAPAREDRPGPTSAPLLSGTAEQQPVSEQIPPPEPPLERDERAAGASAVPFDLAAEARRPPRPADPGELAALVNDALIEQARRHGVDLE